jgi:hypothetical protein
MNIPDTLFSGFRFYRRMCGGVWYKVWEMFRIQGGFILWTQALLSDKDQYKILETEDYTK